MLAKLLRTFFLHAFYPSCSCFIKAFLFFNAALYAAAKALSRSDSKASCAAMIFSNASLAFVPFLFLF